MAAVIGNQLEQDPLGAEPAATRPKLNLIQGGDMEQEPVYTADGWVETEREAVRYRLFITESCDTGQINVKYNGLGGYMESSADWATETTLQACVPTLIFDPVRHDGIWNNVFRPQKAQVDIVPQILSAAPKNKALQNLPNGGHIAFDCVDLEAHSMGGIAATELAKQYPDLVKTVTYMLSVGFNEAQAIKHALHIAMHPRQLAGDILGLIQSPHIGANLGYAALKIVRYGRRPERVPGEVFSILWSNLVDDVMSLKATTFGIESDLDSLVCRSRQLETIVDYYVKASFGHFGPQTQPDIVVAETLALQQAASER